MSLTSILKSDDSTGEGGFMRFGGLSASESSPLDRTCILRLAGAAAFGLAWLFDFTGEGVGEEAVDAVSLSSSGVRSLDRNSLRAAATVIFLPPAGGLVVTVPFARRYRQVSGTLQPVVMMTGRVDCSSTRFYVS